MRTSIPRLHAVRFKSGGELRVMPGRVPEHVQRERDLQFVMRFTAGTIAKHPGDLAGCALVVWGKDGGSTCHLTTKPSSCIPTVLIPHFVEERLRSQVIIGWALDDVRDMLGFTPPPPSA